MKRSRKSFGILAVMILAGSLPLASHNPLVRTAGAANGEEVGPHSPAGSEVTIRIFQFQPHEFGVKAGTTVTWVNQDDIVHTVTSGAPDNHDGKWNFPLPGKGASASLTFDQPGEYEYFCNHHSSMRGRIHVK